MSTRSISLPARSVLGGEMEGEAGTKGTSSSLKGKGSQRGREKEKEIEVRYSWLVLSKCLVLIVIIKTYFFAGKIRNFFTLFQDRSFDCEAEEGVDGKAE